MPNICDICGRQLQLADVQVVRPTTVVFATTNGFVPSRLPSTWKPQCEMLGVTIASHWKTVVSMNAATDWGICRECLDEIDQFNAKSGDVGRAARGAVDQLFDALRSGEQQKVHKPGPQPAADLRNTSVTPKREPASNNATPVPAPEPAPLSETARLLNVFVAPSKTFTDLRRNSSWWGPWLLISVFSIAFMFVVGQQIGFEQVSRNQISQSPRADQFDKLAPEQQAQQLRIAAKVTKYIGYGFPVILLISFSIIAGVLLAAFNLGAGAQVRFATALAIVGYATVPGIIHATLSAIVLFAGVDREGFNIQNPVASNPAYFMTPLGNRFLYGMASALDVFVIWTIVLMGIGFACNSKVKRSTAIILVAVLYVAYKLAASGLAAAFS